MSVRLDVFSVIENLVIEVLGQPAIVRHVIRDSDKEVVTITVNTAEGDLTLRRSWANGDRVRVLGTAVNGDPDTIELFV